MRVPVLVYGVLYVVVEMVGHRLETVGWGSVTPLDLAAALVDALLAIVIAIAVVVAFGLARQRWQPALHAWRARRSTDGTGWDGPGWREDAREPIAVDSWRAGEQPPALEARAPGATGTYGATSAGRRFPEEPGRLL